MVQGVKIWYGLAVWVDPPAVKASGPYCRAGMTGSGMARLMGQPAHRKAEALCR